MKKDLNLPKKNIHSINGSGKNHFQIIQMTQETNHPIILIIEVDHQNKENHKISHKIDFSRSNSQNNQYRNNHSRSNANRTEFFDTKFHSNSRNRHY